MQNKRFLYLNSVKETLSTLNLSKTKNIKIFSVYRNSDYDFKMLSKMNSPYLFKTPTPECVLGVYYDNFYSEKVSALLYMLQSLSFIPANFIGNEPEGKNTKIYTPIFIRTINDYLSGKEYKKDFAMDSLKKFKKSEISTIFNINIFGKISYEEPDLSLMTDKAKLQSITDLNYDLEDFHPLFFMWINDIKHSMDEDMNKLFRPVMDIYDKVDNLYQFLNHRFELLKSNLDVKSDLTFDNLNKEIFKYTKNFDSALLVSDYLSLKYNETIMKRYFQDQHLFFKSH